jgi:hypothetical protein
VKIAKRIKECRLLAVLKFEKENCHAHVPKESLREKWASIHGKLEKHGFLSRSDPVAGLSRERQTLALPSFWKSGLHRKALKRAMSGIPRLPLKWG